VKYLSFIILLLLPFNQALAEAGLTLVTSAANDAGGQSYSVTIRILLIMTALTFLPAALMMTTSFARIVIVLSILRQAVGTPQTPSSQIIIGLALFLSFFVMSPVIDKAYQDSLKPYFNEEISVEVALDKAQAPFRDFMLGQTRETDLAMFADIAGVENIESPEQVPFSLLVPAFMTSELKTAFQIGFLIFVPFVVIDLVVASVLMSMGMMMLSPMLIALPFKLMLFVLVDGWSMIMNTLAASFVV
jgi:flagellar biosynthetic protein FliP